MLTANVLDVAKVLWNGQMVDAVRNEYVLRMPQTNAATAKSPLDYLCKAPVAQTGWSVQSLGSGFFKLTAPGASVTTVTSWAQRQGVQSIDVNRVSKAARAPNDTLYGDASNWGFSRISAPSAWDTVDSPANGTSASVVRLMNDLCVGCSRLPSLPRPGKRLPGSAAFPPGVAFFSCRRGVSPSRAAWPRAGEIGGGAALRGQCPRGHRPLANLRFEGSRLLPAVSPGLGVRR